MSLNSAGGTAAAGGHVKDGSLSVLPPAKDDPDAWAAFLHGDTPDEDRHTSPAIADEPTATPAAGSLPASEGTRKTTTAAPSTVSDKSFASPPKATKKKATPKAKRVNDTPPLAQTAESSSLTAEAAPVTAVIVSSADPNRMHRHSLQNRVRSLIRKRTPTGSPKQLLDAPRTDPTRRSEP